MVTVSPLKKTVGRQLHSFLNAVLMILCPVSLPLGDKLRVGRYDVLAIPTLSSTDSYIGPPKYHRLLLQYPLCHVVLSSVQPVLC
jgi:hypothetical protein